MKVLWLGLEQSVCTGKLPGDVSGEGDKGTLRFSSATVHLTL
jgi:hypothetical protein